MSSDSLKLEELGLKLEELKIEIESYTKETKELEDKKKDINININVIKTELSELYEKKKLKENSAELKNKNFFKLFKISMTIVFCVSLLADFIEGMTINQIFSEYFNFGVLFTSIGTIVVPLHASYIRKINKQGKGINLDEVNALINVKELKIDNLKEELSGIKDSSKLSFENMRKKQEDMSLIRSEIKNLEQQINVNTKKDRRPKQMVKSKQINCKVS